MSKNRLFCIGCVLLASVLATLSFGSTEDKIGSWEFGSSLASIPGSNGLVGIGIGKHLANEEMNPGLRANANMRMNFSDVASAGLSVAWDFKWLGVLKFGPVIEMGYAFGSGPKRYLFSSVGFGVRAEVSRLFVGWEPAANFTTSSLKEYRTGATLLRFNLGYRL